MPPPHKCYDGKFSRSMSNGWRIIKEILQTSLTFTSCLSRSLKIIATDTLRSATYDFALAFHINYGPISRTVSKIKGDICTQKIHSRVYNTPLKSFPWNF